MLRLDALLSALSHESGAVLVNPWPIIHPDGSATSLREALNPRYDDYYRALPKFKFLSCLDHYATGMVANVAKDQPWHARVYFRNIPLGMDPEQGYGTYPARGAAYPSATPGGDMLGPRGGYGLSMTHSWDKH